MYTNKHQPTYADIYTNIHTYIIQKCTHNTSGYIHTHAITLKKLCNTINIAYTT